MYFYGCMEVKFLTAVSVNDYNQKLVCYNSLKCAIQKQSKQDRKQKQLKNHSMCWSFVYTDARRHEAFIISIFFKTFVNKR